MDERARWELIERAARALGVKPQTSKKWRRRGVPHRWRLPIIQRTGGALTSDQFHSFRSDERQPIAGVAQAHETHQIEIASKESAA